MFTRGYLSSQTSVFVSLGNKPHSLFVPIWNKLSEFLAVYRHAVPAAVVNYVALGTNELYQRAFGVWCSHGMILEINTKHVGKLFYVPQSLGFFNIIIECIMYKTAFILLCWQSTKGEFGYAAPSSILS